jgi:hypothetical protein
LGDAQNRGVDQCPGAARQPPRRRPSATDRAKLTDGACKNTVGTTSDTGVYAAGSGIASDLQDLMKDEKDE